MSDAASTTSEAILTKSTHLPLTVGVVTLLDEEEPELQSYALKKLNEIVHNFWAEIADSVSKM